MLLTCLAFLGHLLWLWLVAAGGVPVLPDASAIVFWRNLVVAPLAEEFVFRACMSPLFLMQGLSPVWTVFIVPLYFGAAHLHHVHEKVFVEKESVSVALLQVLAQLSYTTVFGWYANFLFIRTRHLLAPVLAHVICNFCGVPHFPDIVAGPCCHVLLPTLLSGLLAFALLLGPATSPVWFGVHGGNLCEAGGVPVPAAGEMAWW